MNKIIVSNLSKFYDSTVFNPMSFAVEKGEMIAIVGASGAGKTTLIECMLGITKPTTGDVYIDGHLMPDINVLHKTGYMAQSDALYSELTAREHLNFFGSMYKKVTQSDILRVSEITALTNVLNKRVHTFSGGMKRRLSLAICLLHHPELIILDEPTTGLDPLLTNQIWNTFDSLRQQGTTMIITTHNMSEAMRADKLLLLFNHEMIAFGKAEELFEHYNVSSIEDIFIKEASHANYSNQ
ncbi:ABC transporter ATP-binding protein [Macrococcus armenti]|uniref:ABC transporter ATP-binding protein n=1 Tax=Macrococcus armenti TaxID=2875764 RepID=UPI001CCDF793|nr:ABC transporter ATP-binding protein [Macrococcus armenti]UBH09317.1 ABC transporter ATP-binding protein [Macrococcus armenti]UBH11615.1 ABC transporter ATP-binding protein [Macrococcus armenti]